MNMPNKLLIKDVPYHKSGFYPYYCTEASTLMVFEYFCKQTGLDQEKVEDLGGRTYEGGKEFNDIGVVGLFEKVGFEVKRIDNSNSRTTDGNSDFFHEIKETLFSRRMPLVVRMIDRGTKWNHTVVAVGFEGNNLVVHDPDRGANERMKFPNDRFDLTSFLIVEKPSRCKRFV